MDESLARREALEAAVAAPAATAVAPLLAAAMTAAAPGIAAAADVSSGGNPDQGAIVAYGWFLLSAVAGVKGVADKLRRNKDE